MENRSPLQGRRIVVTRPGDQADPLTRRLEELGAEVVAAPMIRIEPPTDEEAVARILTSLGRYDWLVFTSANGVRAFLPRAVASGALTSKLRICAIGEATAGAVMEEGASVDLLPERYVAESVLEAFKREGSVAERHILLARAEAGRDVLVTALTQMGAVVTDLPVYRTVPDEKGANLLREELKRCPVDVLTFTSSSTVQNFADLVTRDVGKALVASIGPITSLKIRELGWRVDIEATVYSADGLVDAIGAHFAADDGWNVNR